MFFKSIKETLQKHKQEELERLKEIRSNAERFEQSVLEAMEAMDQELNQAEKDKPQ